LENLDPKIREQLQLVVSNSRCAKSFLLPFMIDLHSALSLHYQWRSSYKNLTWSSAKAFWFDYIAFRSPPIRLPQTILGLGTT